MRQKIFYAPPPINVILITTLATTALSWSLSLAVYVKTVVNPLLNYNRTLYALHAVTNLASISCLLEETTHRSDYYCMPYEAHK